MCAQLLSSSALSWCVCSFIHIFIIHSQRRCWGEMKKQVYRCITILTGAGISAESGIATFRDRDGLWCSHRIEDVACPGAYVKDPLLVHRFYDERRLNLLDVSVKPNPAHMAIAHLQRAYKDGEVHLITQNVDDLHERGGSTSVLHMHGELLKMRCENTGLVVEMRRAFNPRADRCPCCDRLHTLRPHIVWFGEVPMHLDEIDAMLSKTDLFVAIGTSGNVYPAAGYAAEVRQRGAATLELNMTEGANQSMFDASRYGAASEVVPRWVDSVLDGTFCIKG